MPHNKRKAFDEASTSSEYPQIGVEEPIKKQARYSQDSNTEKLTHKRKCLIIGAGVSGILLAYHFQKYLSDEYEFNILEKNTDVGGTWLENSYPGCACDVPTEIYQFSFAPIDDWSALYAPSGEIQHYLARVVKHFGLRKYVEFETKVEKCQWSEEKKKWTTVARNAKDQVTEYESDILINACGILNNYKFPEINDLDKFEGTLMHTANWDHSIDLTGKKVALIGAGASAVQVVPQVQPIVDSLYVYIRTPAWISKPTLFEKDDQLGSVKDAEKYQRRCKEFEEYFNKLFPLFRRGSADQVENQKNYASRMRELIKDPELQKKLIPKYELGCRRINPSEIFLHALQKDNVECVFDPIISCGPNGLKTDSGIREADIIVAATGFDTSFRPRFPLIGRNNIDLRDLWKDDPASYMGIGCSNFPNYLMMLGPNCPIANGSVIGSLEATADFFVRLLKRVAKSNVASFSPDSGAQKDFNDHIEEYMKDMVWSGPCTSWYKRGFNGKVTAVWPGSSLHYREVLEENRWEDWNWEYSGPRYKTWDGKSMIEKSGGDHSYYLLHGPFLPRVSS